MFVVLFGTNTLLNQRSDLLENQADSGFVDALRERLASPFLFTFFWLMCTWNWKIIYWFINEPLKPSLKFESIPKDMEWSFGWPVLLTFVVVVFVPWLNNFADVAKEWATGKANTFMHKKGMKKMVTAEKFEALLEENANLKQRVHTLLKDAENAKNEEAKALDEKNAQTGKFIEVQKQLGLAQEQVIEQTQILKNERHKAAEDADLNAKKIDELNDQLKNMKSELDIKYEQLESLRSEKVKQVGPIRKPLDNQFNSHNYNPSQANEELSKERLEKLKILAQSAKNSMAYRRAEMDLNKIDVKIEKEKNTKNSR